MITRQHPNTNPSTILFTHFGDPWIRGSELVLLHLIKRIDRARFRPVLWCNAEPMARQARELDCAVYRGDFQSFLQAPKSLAKLRLLQDLVRQGAALIRAEDVRLIHANSAAPTQWLIPLGRTFRLPVVSHLHAPYSRRDRFHYLLHQATATVGVSNDVVRGLVEDGVTARRIHTIPNDIDTSHFNRHTSLGNVRKSLSLDPSDVLITSVASLNHRKAHDVLMTAFARLDASLHCHLLLVGDGPNRDSLIAHAAALGVQDRVHLLGQRDPKDLSEIYGATDIFALLSRQEAFGLVLAEAGYFALPAVATNVGGIPDVVKDGLTGILVPPDAPNAAACALAELVKNPVRRQQIGAAAQAHVQACFAAGRMVSQFERLYTEFQTLPPRNLGWLATFGTLRSYLSILRQPHPVIRARTAAAESPHATK